MDNRFKDADSQIAKLTAERDMAVSNFTAAQRDAQVLHTALTKNLSVEQAAERYDNFTGFDGGVSPTAHPAQQWAAPSADEALRAAAGF